MRARIKFIKGARYSCPGRQDFVKGEVRITTDEREYRYYRNQACFKVTRLKEKAPKEVAPVEDANPASELPKWSSKSKRTELVTACTARDIAVSTEDSKAVLVETLQAFDHPEDEA